MSQSALVIKERPMERVTFRELGTSRLFLQPARHTRVHIPNFVPNFEGPESSGTRKMLRNFGHIPSCSDFFNRICDVSVGSFRCHSRSAGLNKRSLSVLFSRSVGIRRKKLIFRIVWNRLEHTTRCKSCTKTMKTYP